MGSKTGRVKATQAQPVRITTKTGNIIGGRAERLKQANGPLVAQPSRAAHPSNGLKTVSMTSPSGQLKG